MGDEWSSKDESWGYFKKFEGISIHGDGLVVVLR